jgi:hypothetical protein
MDQVCKQGPGLYQKYYNKKFLVAQARNIFPDRPNAASRVALSVNS